MRAGEKNSLAAPSMELPCCRRCNGRMTLPEVNTYRSRCENCWALEVQRCNYLVQDIKHSTPMEVKRVPPPEKRGPRKRLFADD